MLFIIIWYDFDTHQKRYMSEGCGLFIYFKDASAILRVEGFHLQVISAKYEEL